MSDTCSNCGAVLKVGVISSNQPLSPGRLRVINLASSEHLDAACNKCGDPSYRDATEALELESRELRAKLTAILSHVPIVSLQQPMGWTYEPLGIITAQTVTGTGIFSDVASAFTDLFGTQSGAYNAKLRDGENLCKASLRAQAIEQGGNAVLGVDVDYAEVGGQRAMLMVCMTGTAVCLTQIVPDDPSFFDATRDGASLANRARDIQDALQSARV